MIAATGILYFVLINSCENNYKLKHKLKSKMNGVNLHGETV